MNVSRLFTINSVLAETMFRGDRDLTIYVHRVTYGCASGFELAEVRSSISKNGGAFISSIKAASNSVFVSPFGVY